MAIKLFKVDNFHSGLHKEFFIDGENDLEQIEVEFDCELGDKAYAPNGTIYTRHSDEFDGDLWEEIKNEDSDGDSDSDLPEVTAEDNGDVLTVVNGAWDKAAPSGGGSLTDIADAVITCTIDDNDFVVSAYEILKGTFADVYDKVTNGQPVLVVGIVSNDVGGGTVVDYHGVVSVIYNNSIPNILSLNMGGEFFLQWDSNGITTQ